MCTYGQAAFQSLMHIAAQLALPMCYNEQHSLSILVWIAPAVALQLHMPCYKQARGLPLKHQMNVCPHDLCVCTHCPSAKHALWSIFAVILSALQSHVNLRRPRALKHREPTMYVLVGTR